MVAWQTSALMSRIVYFYGEGLCAVSPQKSVFCLGLVLYFRPYSVNQIDAESQSVALWAMRFIEETLHFGGSKLDEKLSLIENYQIYVYSN